MSFLRAYLASCCANLKHIATDYTHTELKYPRIRNLREDNDLTQQQIADMLYINRRTYAAYENGINSMTPETLCKIADIYHTSVDWLLGRTDEFEPYPENE